MPNRARLRPNPTKKLEKIDPQGPVWVEEDRQTDSIGTTGPIRLGSHAREIIDQAISNVWLAISPNHRPYPHQHFMLRRSLLGWPPDGRPRRLSAESRPGLFEPKYWSGLGWLTQTNLWPFMASGGHHKATLGLPAPRSTSILPANDEHKPTSLGYFVEHLTCTAKIEDL